MCGFVSQYNFSNLEKVDVNNVRRALDDINHRGPDERNIWTSNDGNISMGHTRLSLIGLDSGLQPIVDDTGSVVSVVNGELYGYKDIREKYRQSYPFRTQSDSEILLPLYKHYGLNLFDHLRGEFSFVLWDDVNKRLLAARDRFGIKPLYYAISNGSVYLSSEIKGLLALGVKPVWNQSAVYSSERMLYPSRDSCFEGIYQVPAGHYLTITDNNSVEIKPYWEKGSYEPDLNLNEHDFVTGFLEHFDDAVKQRMVADVDIGCYLSGGIDSGAVLGTAARVSGKAPESYTIVFDNENYDELDRAKLQADFVGSKLNVLRVTEQDIVDNFDKSVRSFETPFGNTHGIAKVLLSGFVRQNGCKVVLTGEGADEVLGGYPHFREDVFRYERQHMSESDGKKLLNEMYGNYSKFPGFLLEGEIEKDLERFGEIFGYKPGMMRTGSQRGKVFSSLYKPELSAHHQRLTPYTDIIKHIDWSKTMKGDILHRSLNLWQESVLPSYILNVLGDRAEMANSVEGRVPFLDHNLYKFLMSVPSKLKISGSTEKYLLRAAMEGRVHPTVLNQCKEPFMAPPVKVHSSDLVSSPLYDYMGDTFTSQSIKDQPFYCPKKVLKSFDSLRSIEPSSRMELDRILTFVLSICIMQREFNIGVR
ncbi:MULTISPECIES: asparagine synthase (glutamine-hydrolyzing) [unclassified Vibrio]|uniref:asparagine synthase (glutamine-hydrolyzing) n=1 Tax=Vibrio TaxID=662 RepID=UPI001F02DCC1|nr:MULTISPECIES: asparagine synthase (glutamine-hydrolyzing) [unclassified Vibrio]MCF7506113.1 asparagine synthase (glutamine-hydrolyzing) [Vibrio sp. L3-7]